MAYWKITTDTSGSTGWPKDLDIYAGNSTNSTWQSTPILSLKSETNTIQLANEPVVLKAYTFATLPTSPNDWQRALITDKAIGSGSQGVMAMYNPNTKTWTGLSGEALV